MGSVLGLITFHAILVTIVSFYFPDQCKIFFVPRFWYNVNHLVYHLNRWYTHLSITRVTTDEFAEIFLRWLRKWCLMDSKKLILSSFSTNVKHFSGLHSFFEEKVILPEIERENLNLSCVVTKRTILHQLTHAVGYSSTFYMIR